MISLDEVKKFKIPKKIDFLAEEQKRRDENINRIKKFLNTIKEYPDVVSDFQKWEFGDLKKKEFNTKYTSKTGYEDFHDECKIFMIKFENFCDDFNIEIEDLITHMMDDIFLAYKFIIDLKKQNPYEKMVEDYFSFMEKDLHLTSVFKHIPVSGEGAKYVHAGDVCDASLKGKVKKTDSSIDFVWDYTFKNKTLNFYASHKYTHGTGSVQKHQLENLETFLKNCLDAEMSDICFVAIMDGNYYTDYPYPNFIPNSKQKPRIIEHIRNQKKYSECIIATSNDLFEKILIKIKEWLGETFSPADTKEEIAKIDILLDKCSKC